MLQFNKNNLADSSSPYLQQHKNNPIHWQEWSKEILDYAKKENKILFVSVGYATCHWCHVMAAEAFSNNEIADFLNEHFVAIKVDREQRPDIDQYMMAFLIEQQGHGGWPLNVICTPDAKPFLAMTYVSVVQKYGMSGLLDILKHAVAFYEQNKERISAFTFSSHVAEVKDEKELIEAYSFSYNEQSGGFSAAAQFPPHNTLLFLLYYYEKNKNQKIKTMVEKTLDAMATRGLHDHLQGGFYRYCVDSSWLIPHFEKMLYDQALLLWVYSIAYKVLKKEEYKQTVKKLLVCLEETFHDKETGLYYSGHDADTAHQEGVTYLWTKEELQNVLSNDEFVQFCSLYEITDSGNFEGKNHLLKKKFAFMNVVENKLLLERKKRAQPFVDRKIITSWNALTGIGLLMAWRCTDNMAALEKANILFDNLIKKHYTQNKIIHSSFGTSIQEQEFLEDYSAVLLFATYLYEENFHEKTKQLIETLYQKIISFNVNSVWIESRNPDFVSVPAQNYDHPTPSSVSLAEFALLRTNIILGKEYRHSSGNYTSALSHDFFNLQTFFRNGNFHIFYTSKNIPWQQLPMNSMQVFGNGEKQ